LQGYIALKHILDSTLKPLILAVFNFALCDEFEEFSFSYSCKYIYVQGWKCYIWTQ